MKMKKNNTTPAPGTEGSKRGVRREKTVSSLYALLLILTLLVTMGYCTFKQFKVERDDAYASLHNSMYSLRSLISFEGTLQDSFANLRDSETLMYAELAVPFFDYLGVSTETLNSCKYNWEASDLYFFPDEGSVVTTDNAVPFSLDKSQTRMLKTVGMLIQDEWVYNAVRLKDGWLFIRWLQYDNIYNVDFERIAEAVPSALALLKTLQVKC